jgi:hypothetical protein
MVTPFSDRVRLVLLKFKNKILNPQFLLIRAESEKWKMYKPSGGSLLVDPLTKESENEGSNPWPQEGRK